MLVNQSTTIQKHMNLKTLILTLTACLIAFAAPATVHAAKGTRKTAKADRAARPRILLKKYDTDHDGKIAGTEIEALRKAFDADKTGPLKKLDANNDMTLDDSEVAAIKPRHRKGSPEARKARKKTNQNA